MAQVENTLGARLKLARDALSLSQKDISDKVGCGHRSWQDYESDKKVPGSQVIAGLALLGINTNWLLTGEGAVFGGGRTTSTTASQLAGRPPYKGEDSIGGRLKYLRGEKSTDEFARAMGLDRDATRACEKGASTPDAGFIQSILNAGISPHWLLYGIGTPIMPENNGDHRVSKSEIAEAKDYEYVKKLVSVEVSTGAGTEPTDGEGVEELAFRRKWLTTEGLNPNNLRLVTSRGDSMTPTVPEDSILLVDISQNEFVREGVYVIRLDGHLFAKRLQRGQAGAVLVISDNPRYSSITVEPGSHELEIVGKVVWLGHTL